MALGTDEEWMNALLGMSDAWLAKLRAQRFYAARADRGPHAEPDAFVHVRITSGLAAELEATGSRAGRYLRSGVAGPHGDPARVCAYEIWERDRGSFETGVSLMALGDYQIKARVSVATPASASEAAAVVLADAATAAAIAARTPRARP